MHRARYIMNCAEIPRELEPVLGEIMAYAEPISREYFARCTHADDRAKIEWQLGYTPSSRPRITEDPAVTYFKSKVEGRQYIILVHSRVEYVFAKPPRQATSRKARNGA